ncbi:MAG TPA: hypothetical protein PLY70_04030 [Saprospiraceae bacterium]|nr:hypothetical protein [Saprospiraceae bacterium]
MVGSGLGLSIRYPAMNLSIKNWSKLIALALLMTSTVGCQKDDATFTVLNVNTGLTVSLDQTLTENGGIPSVIISTTDQQDCSNAKFMYTTSVFNNHSDLNLTGITLNGEACQSGSAKITTSLLLDKLITLNNFTISLGSDAKFPGLVTIVGQRAKLSMQNQKGIVSNNNEIVLIESGVYWGSIALDKSLDSTAVWSAQKLMKDISIKDFTPEYGDYGFFTYGQDGVSIKKDNFEGASTNFILKINPVHSKDLIANLQKIPGIKAKVYGFNGSKISW